jgi:hypothetical protein
VSTLKTKPAPEPDNQNALAQLGLDSPLANMLEGERKEFLPYIKLSWEIEGARLDVLDNDGKPMLKNGKPIQEPAAGKVIVSSGESDKKLETPFLITILAGRNAARELVTKDGKKTYKRVYDSVKGDHTPAYIEILKSAGYEIGSDGKRHGIKGATPNTNIQLGCSYLVAVINPAEGTPSTCVLGLLETFKTQEGYWRAVCKHALFKDATGVVVEIDDHTENMTASQENVTNKYYDGRKFNQWRQITMTGQQMQLIDATVRAKREACEGWFKR